MELDGIDALFKKLDSMEETIEEDVDEIVKNNTIELTMYAKENGVEAFNKGYATGFTVRSITMERVASMHYKTISQSGHSGYLEYGTRFMEAAPFIFPAYKKVKQQFQADLKRLVE
ncbi:HK97-gp10 family putative phage morphogenesis protein [Salinicoccus roseus]|uniref:HK97-gp10 family putative phage morphogenesis protein n=1 Tax=Salinicoccus roseus TaxID=45670 RepID=UPI00230123D6|nr:HK97-gp10 family putative phage morphogenesis protein [Salinicoccus roseus]